MTATLALDIAAADLASATAANLVYDTRGDGDLSLTVNDAALGQVPNQRTALAATNIAWVRRSFALSTTILREGFNTLSLALSGDVDIDRVELELFYPSTRP